MSRRRGGSNKNKDISLLVSIVLIFFILGVIVISVSKKVITEMSAAATQNLNESLDLIECTLEAILNKEAEYQRLMAQGLATSLWYSASLLRIASAFTNSF